MAARSLLFSLLATAWLVPSAGVRAAERDERIQADYGRHQFEDYEREHWAFVPVVRPNVPSVSQAAWASNSIDLFVLAALESAGLEPAPPAPRATLLRRVFLDLIGLPPTPAEQEAFLADRSPDAFSRVVDDLLARPQYGQRWGRHWLDVVRFAESNGYERDGAKPNVWRYRDYVIDSLNEDKPFDQFLIEQIAGDEVVGSDAQSQIATTFLRLGPWDDEPADPMVDRYDQLNDVLDGTVTAFLGLSLRCARCHDHKFEPFTQQDYARVIAVFEPLVRPQNGRTELDLMVGTDGELSAYREASSIADSAVADLQKRMSELNDVMRTRMFATADHGFSAEVVAAFTAAADKRSEDQKKLVKENEKKVEETAIKAATEEELEQLTACGAEIAAVNGSRPAEPPRGYIWEEKNVKPPATFVFARGNPSTPADQVTAGLPAVLVDKPPSPAEPTGHSTGRRKQFADWIASPHNPLTARVIVNRLWQHHLGDGIVGTENDFGLMGEAPTHPELLDYLASELVAGGWRLKRMHKLIVLSSTYQMASASNEAAHQRDADVDLLWRFKPRRLAAETVRDSILAVSGRLNLDSGGPSMYPKIAKEVLAGQSKPGQGWGESDAAATARRSVYVFVKRTLIVPELEVLDFPNTNASCEQRSISTVAPQALTYLNGQFIHDQSTAFADRLAREVPQDTVRRVERAFRLTWCRAPSDEEKAAALDFLELQQRQIETDQTAAGKPSDQANRAALAALCLVLLNTNEFVYIE